MELNIIRYLLISIFSMKNKAFIEQDTFKYPRQFKYGLKIKNSGLKYPRNEKNADVFGVQWVWRKVHKIRKIGK